MDGFEIFFYISFGVTILFVIASILLKKIKYEKYIRLVFARSLLISIVIIIISLIVGGWTGMGYGFIGLSILIGTIIGGLIVSVIKYFEKT